MFSVLDTVFSGAGAGEVEELAELQVYTARLEKILVYQFL